MQLLRAHGVGKLEICFVIHPPRRQCKPAVFAGALARTCAGDRASQRTQKEGTNTNLLSHNLIQRTHE